MLRALTAWWRRRGLRSRVTLTAAAGLLIAFTAADLLLFSALRASLTKSVDDSARQAANQVVALINSQPLPDPVPIAASTVAVQVLSPTGQIIDISPGADRLVPLLSLPQATASAHSASAVTLSGGPYGLPPQQLRVVAATAANGSIVIAAVPYTTAHASLAVVSRALWLGTPLLLLLFTGAIWLAVGSTLRPITLLRRGAAAVSVTGVPRALPVPGARDEVRALALTLNGMLSRLSLARQRQRDLVSDTAHELRSPIASIRTQLEVALDHPELQEWSETARDVHADVLRLARLAEDLLVLARLDERVDADGAARDADSVADLAEVSACVVWRYAGTRVPVVLEAPAPCPVRGDAAALDRVLVNLIDNALRYAKSQVKVWVGRADDASGAGGLDGTGTDADAGGWAELAVTDDGPGIPAADLERAFDRFTRLDPARSRDSEADGGAGLGLAIVRATAEAFGGTARLEPASPSPDGGTPGLRAVVRLPFSPFLPLADEKGLRARPVTAALPSPQSCSACNATVAYAITTGTAPPRARSRSSNGTITCAAPQRQRHQRCPRVIPSRPQITPRDQNLAPRGCTRHRPDIIYNQMVVDKLTGDEADRVFQALADATRRDILARAMRQGESVSELSRRYAMSFAAVQKHVAVLQRAALVTKEKRGREQIVHGNAQTLRRAAELLDAYEQIWIQRAARIADILAEEAGDEASREAGEGKGEPS
jgi:signal transduction histidine kinase/DNA-binding transcriptional ArsR family regulator